MAVRVFACIALCAAWCTDRLRPLRRAERGEGVISVAIAVLIMALIGGGLYIVFDRAVGGAEGRIEESIEGIG